MSDAPVGIHTMTPNCKLLPMASKSSMRVVVAHFQSTSTPNVFGAPISGALGTHYGFTVKGQFLRYYSCFRGSNSFVDSLAPFPALGGLLILP